MCFARNSQRKDYCINLTVWREVLPKTFPYIFYTRLLVLCIHRNSGQCSLCRTTLHDKWTGRTVTFPLIVKINTYWCVQTHYWGWSERTQYKPNRQSPCNTPYNDADFSFSVLHYRINLSLKSQDGINLVCVVSFRQSKPPSKNQWKPHSSQRNVILLWRSLQKPTSGLDICHDDIL